jgi:anti-sigma factor RsiW
MADHSTGGHWTAKLDGYLDGELPAGEMRELDAHLRSCPPCAADVLGRVQIKRAVHSAGLRYRPSAEFRERVRARIAVKPRRSPVWMWLGAGVAAALALVVGLSFRQGEVRRQAFSELADLHVATLASANPVDVISTDRHTVKPWFQGKIPFSFNLPELQGSEFTLVGGRVTYFEQTPGAHLIYQIRKHEISVFIFQDRPGDAESLPAGLAQALSFNVENWSQDGLRYFVVGDVSAGDIQALSKLLRDAG